MRNAFRCEICDKSFDDEDECLRHENAHGECFVVLDEHGRPKPAAEVIIHSPGFRLRHLKAKKLASDVAMGDYTSRVVEGSRCDMPPKPKDEKTSV